MKVIGHSEERKGDRKSGGRHVVMGNSGMVFGVTGKLRQYEGSWGRLQNAGRVCLRPAVLPRGHLEFGDLWVRRETRENLERMDET